MPPAPRILYNLGSGPRRLFRQLPDAKAFEGWEEIRVDVDPDCRPDIIANLTNMRPCIPDCAAGMIYCSHVIEHFFYHDIPRVLAEFVRILHPDGAAVIRLPDLAAVVRAFDESDLERPLYHSRSGPIAALDVIYGHRRSIEEGNVFMAHRTGFTEASLARQLLAAGFDEVQTVPGPSVEFCAVATLRPTGFHDQVKSLLSFVNP